jgi:Icc-related predicted phosphoesterase
MRILFLSDFHGRVPDISEWDADLVVAGGDYCEVDEIRDLKFAAMARGWSATEWTRLAGQGKADELVERALAEGSAVVAALAECGLPVLAIPGNSDRVALINEAITQRHLPRPDHPAVDGRITDIETRIVVHGGIAFAGLGGWSGPANSQRLENDLAELRGQWQRLLDERARLGTAAPPLVLVSHNVPYGSRLDGVNNPAVPAYVQGKLVGSYRAKAVIEALSPVLCLSGHLHENYGRTEVLGRTLCLCGAGAYRGDAVRLEVQADGSVGVPEFVSARRGAARVLSGSSAEGQDAG